MPKKLDTTPDGMICRVCGEDKPPYHFFKPRGKFNKAFFANGVPDGHTCFDCAGDYRCVGCGQIWPSTAYRLQGRYCEICRAAGIRKNGSVGSETSTKNDATPMGLVIEHEDNDWGLETP